MNKKRKRRSAIVPAMVLSASLAGGLCVVPALVTGCNGLPTTSVAADAFQPGVADLGFHPGVAGDGFQVGVADIGFSVAADFARPPVGLDVAAQDFAQPPFGVAATGFDMSAKG